MLVESHSRGKANRHIEEKLDLLSRAIIEVVEAGFGVAFFAGEPVSQRCVLNRAVVQVRHCAVLIDGVLQFGSRAESALDFKVSTESLFQTPLENNKTEVLPSRWSTANPC